jgi:hypothetical protein
MAKKAKKEIPEEPVVEEPVVEEPVVEEKVEVKDESKGKELITKFGQTGWMDDKDNFHPLV